VVRPSGAIFVEAVFNKLMHVSLHLPSRGADLADCHYRIAGDLVKNGTVRIAPNGPKQKQIKWSRKVADRSIEAALHMIFPAQFALASIPIPDREKLSGLALNEFEIPPNQSLRVEFLFGPQDDSVWNSRFTNYGLEQWYVDIPTGERFGLNFFNERNDYASYIAGERYRSLRIQRDGDHDLSTEYRIMLGAGWGRHTAGMLHGNPSQLRQR